MRFCTSFSTCKQASETKLYLSTLSLLCVDNCSCIHPRGLPFTVMLPSEWHHSGLQQDPGLFPWGCFSNEVNLKFVYLIHCVTAAPLHHKSMKPPMTWRVEREERLKSEVWGCILNTSLLGSMALLEGRWASSLAFSSSFFSSFWLDSKKSKKKKKMGWNTEMVDGCSCNRRCSCLDLSQRISLFSMERLFCH